MGMRMTSWYDIKSLIIIPLTPWFKQESSVGGPAVKSFNSS